MGIAMFVLFVVFIFLGMPIAYSLGLSSLVYLLVMDIPLSIIPQKMFVGIDAFTLLCIPGFILAGNLMNTGGISDRIIEFCQSLLGHIRGGFGLVNIGASVVFAGISGTAIADVSSLGTILIPAMVDEGYDDDFAVAVTASSSVIGPIIPPSVPMILAGTLTGVSIADMFTGGMLPGIVLAVALSVVCFYISKKKNYPKRQWLGWGNVWKATKHAGWALLMPIFLRFGIVFGWFTPTEASIVTVVYAIVIGMFIYKELKVGEMFTLMRSSLRNAAAVLVLVGLANVFAWILTAEQIPQQIAAAILGVSDNKFVVILVINLILIFVGMFMESTAAVVIMFPVLLPVATQIGMDPVQFGVMAVLNLMIGLTTPPVGICLYVAAQIGKVPVARAIKADIPFIVASLLALALIAYVPFFTTWLPSLFG